MTNSDENERIVAMLCEADAAAVAHVDANGVVRRILGVAPALNGLGLDVGADIAGCFADDDRAAILTTLAVDDAGPLQQLVVRGAGSEAGSRYMLSAERAGGPGPRLVVVRHLANLVDDRRLDTSDELLAQLPDYLIRVDVNGVITDLNRTDRETTRSIVIGTNASQWMAPESLQQFNDALSTVRTRGGTAQYEFVYRSKAGQRNFQVRASRVQESDASKGFLLIARDITELVSAVATAQSAEERLETALTSAGLSTFEWWPQLPSAMFSADFAARVGIPRSLKGDDVAQYVTSIVSGETFASLAVRALDEVNRTGSFQFDVPILVDDVVVRHEARGQVIDRDDAGGPLRISGVLENVEEKRKSEEARRALERQLHQSQRMESVGKLAGGIAHDFNNFLQVMLGHVSLALETENIDVAVEDDLLHIREAATKAAELTKQLLAFARQEPLRFVATDVNGAVERLAKMLRRLLPVTVEIDMMRGVHLSLARADAARIEQVLLNLCLNARDAMPGGGRITIETENVAINGAFRRRYPWARPGRYVLISVSDTGMGMSQDVLERAFEPFFTTRPQGEATGLGLSVVYAIVEQHEGMVHLYSEPGVGTRAKVYLPVAERSADAVERSPTARIPEGRELILVAEDDDMVRNLVLRVLGRAGYRVISARDGQEALALFKENVNQIDLVLLDAVMPRMTGRAACEAMVEAKPNTKILFTSGYSAASLPNDFLNEMKIPLLSKPYDPDGLLRKVREILDGAAPERLPAESA